MMAKSVQAMVMFQVPSLMEVEMRSYMVFVMAQRYGVFVFVEGVLWYFLLKDLMGILILECE